MTSIIHNIHLVIRWMPKLASTYTQKCSQVDAPQSKNVTGAAELFGQAEHLLRSRCIPSALAGYHKAEELGYDADACAGARWLCYMLLGLYSHAWMESDSINRRGRPDPNRFWDGNPLNGKRVMVRCLHGLGDTLQYARYLPGLRQQASRVILEAQPDLKRLMCCTDAADEFITWTDESPSWDTQIEIVELPRISRTALETIPPLISYPRLPRAEFALRPRALHVGLVWESGAYNPARSVPVSELACLLDTPRCEFFSLQAGNTQSILGEHWGVHALYQPGACVYDTASQVLALDLVISVDTMLAHLAGSLRRPVWTLLPFEADWRWMLDREDSPWYPSMRLFRQPEPGDWRSVIQQVKTELVGAAARAA